MTITEVVFEQLDAVMVEYECDSVADAGETAYLPTQNREDS